jgi:predicted DNA-binding protein (MmcQ/YjbR family)
MAHPRMYDDSNPALNRLRELCLALPGTIEKEAWGECTFRVSGGSMFAMTDNNHHRSGHLAVWVKAPPAIKEVLVRSDGQRFFVPPYMGPKGWVGVRLDYKVNWNELAGIIKDGYLMSAPKRLGRTGSSVAGASAATPEVTRNRRSRRRPKVNPSSNGKDGANT